MRKISSLKLRFMVLLVILLILLFSLNTYIVVSREYDLDKEALLDEFRSFSRFSAKPIASNHNLYYESGFFKYKEILEEIMSYNKNILNIELLDVKGKILFRSNELIEGKYSSRNNGFRYEQDWFIINKLKSLEPYDEEITSEEGHILLFIQPIIEDWGRHDYSIVYTFSFSSLDKSLKEIILTQVVTNLIFFVISVFLIFLFLGKFITNPLSKLTSGVRTFGEGTLNTHIDINSRDEVGELASSFNQMAERINNLHSSLKRHERELEKKVKERTKELDNKVKEAEQSKIATLNIMEDVDDSNKKLLETQKELEHYVKQLKDMDVKKDEFISVAAHELKTPLTSIKGFTDLLKNEKIMANKVLRKKYFDIIVKDTNRLGQLITDILDLSRIDLNTLKLNSIDQPLGIIVQELIEQMDIIIKQKGVNAVYDVQSNLPNLFVDKNRLIQVLSNFINNSVHYTDKGGEIILRVRADEKNAFFIVQDTGRGIPKEHLPKIFNRFYQVDSSYTRKIGGTGLGLAICKNLIETMGGTVNISSSVGKGTLVSFNIPVNSGVSSGSSREDNILEFATRKMTKKTTRKKTSKKREKNDKSSKRKTTKKKKMKK